MTLTAMKSVSLSPTVKMMHSTAFPSGAGAGELDLRSPIQILLPTSESAVRAVSLDVPWHCELNMQIAAVYLGPLIRTRFTLLHPVKSRTSWTESQQNA